MERDEFMVAAEKEAEVWRALFAALAGSSPLHQFSYDDREAMKSFATAVRRLNKDMPPADRVGAWLLHAFSHWLRTWEAVMTTWPAEEFDEAFPAGLNFRRYLCAWLFSVGRHPDWAERISDEELEAIYAATGCAPVPHELLPLGASELRRWPQAV